MPRQCQKAVFKEGIKWYGLWQSCRKLCDVFILFK